MSHLPEGLPILGIQRFVQKNIAFTVQLLHAGIVACVRAANNELSIRVGFWVARGLGLGSWIKYKASAYEGAVCSDSDTDFTFAIPCYTGERITFKARWFQTCRDFWFGALQALWFPHPQ